jgi:hypothetical protein
MEIFADVLIKEDEIKNRVAVGCIAWLDLLPPTVDDTASGLRRYGFEYPSSTRP